MLEAEGKMALELRPWECERSVDEIASMVLSRLLIEEV
jgi:hypothetical protein